MPRDTVGCYNWEGDATGTYWVESSDSVTILQCTGLQRSISLKMSIVPRLRSSDVPSYRNVTIGLVFLRIVEQGGRS